MHKQQNKSGEYLPSSPAYETVTHARRRPSTPKIKEKLEVERERDWKKEKGDSNVIIDDVT